MPERVALDLLEGRAYNAVILIVTMAGIIIPVILWWVAYRRGRQLILSASDQATTSGRRLSRRTITIPRRLFFAVVGVSASLSLAVAALQLLPVSTAAPTIAVTPGHGAAGTDVSVSGRNFGRMESLDIRFANQPIARTQAGEDGRFTASFHVPANASAGVHTVVAIGQRSASAQFDVTP